MTAQLSLGSRLLALQILLISGLVIVAILGSAKSASADTYYPLIRITCVPEASYAAVETLGLYNVASAARPALSIQGLYELSALAEKPFICDLPQGKLVIKVLNYHPPQLEGMCSQVEDADLSISLAGVEIDSVKGTHGGCTTSQRHDIRITGYELDHCVLKFNDAAQVVMSKAFTAVNTECRSIPLS